MTLQTLAWTLMAGCTGGPDDTADTDDTGIDVLPAPDLSDLSQAGGCVDLVMTMGDPSGELVLIFNHGAGLAQQAFEGEGTAQATLDLATEGSLELWQGVAVTNIPCNDALYGNELVVSTWTVTSGVAEVEVVSDGSSTAWGEYPGGATLKLTDVVLSEEGAEDVEIDELEWTAWVGWMPG
ncbi:MAG TPA: hypothetical protein QGF58_15350 [Myxococcota bacterium]|nr:hypothetical protein [Myxococcota bacterium]